MMAENRCLDNSSKNAHPKTQNLIIYILILTVAVIGGCGGDESVVEPENGTSEEGVAVRLASWNALSGEGAVRFSPAGVEEVRFTISSRAMHAIDKSIQVSQQIVEERFDVPEAPVVKFDVQALDGSAQVLYRGVYYAEVNQGTDLVLIAMVSVSDTSPPSFAGLAAAEAYSDSDARLSWDPASDQGSAPTDIVYLIYAATTQGGQDYSFPDLATKPGHTHATLSGLGPGTMYHVVVRAMDPAGNADANTNEQSLTTFSTDDILYVNVDTGADSPSCGTQQSPCKSITYAVDKSTDHQTFRVARGTYSPATGEVFPIKLKDGMTIIGDGDWVPTEIGLHTITFWPRTIAEADTAPVFESADNASLIALYLKGTGPGSPSAMVYDYEMKLTVFRCVLDGSGKSPGDGVMLAGTGSRVEECKIFDFGKGVWAWGEDVVITRNRFEDNATAVGFQHCNNSRVSYNHMTGGSSAALTCDFSVDPVFLSNYIADHVGDGIVLTSATRPQIIANVIKNCQRGIWLGGADMPDYGRVAFNTIVDNTSIGLVVKTNDVDIHNNAFACNHPYGLHIESAVEIDARWNRWENNPPTIGRNTDQYTAECPGEWDICYEDKHAGVPEPLYLPTSGKAGCKIYYRPPLSPSFRR